MQVKGYANNLTIISIDQQSYKDTLKGITSLNLDIQVQTDKCITISFNGHKMKKVLFCDCHKWEDSKHFNNKNEILGTKHRCLIKATTCTSKI